MIEGQTYIFGIGAKGVLTWLALWIGEQMSLLQPCPRGREAMGYKVVKIAFKSSESTIAAVNRHGPQ